VFLIVAHTQIVVTAAEMQELDRHTIEVAGIPSAVLMERAALAVVDALTKEDFDLAKVVCVCGAGNNGGDGFAVTRLLHLAGYQAEALFIGDADKLSPETQRQWSIAEHYGVSIRQNDPGPLRDGSATTLVDALFGIGLKRPLEGIYREVIEAMDALAAKTLAVDIPSGISADTGEILGAAVQADTTVTFAYNKRGLTLDPGKALASKLIIADIGIYASR
jgi:NAD(P)H-hydrate epimerase